MGKRGATWCRGYMGYSIFFLAKRLILNFNSIKLADFFSCTRVKSISPFALLDLFRRLNLKKNELYGTVKRFFVFYRTFAEQLKEAKIFFYHSFLLPELACIKMVKRLLTNLMITLENTWIRNKWSYMSHCISNVSVWKRMLSMLILQICLSVYTCVNIA